LTDSLNADSQGNQLGTNLLASTCKAYTSEIAAKVASSLSQFAFLGFILSDESSSAGGYGCSHRRSRHEGTAFVTSFERVAALK
jgi:hypothetical protein